MATVMDSISFIVLNKLPGLLLWLVVALTNSEAAVGPTSFTIPINALLWQEHMYK